MSSTTGDHGDGARRIALAALVFAAQGGCKADEPIETGMTGDSGQISKGVATAQDDASGAKGGAVDASAPSAAEAGDSTRADASRVSGVEAGLDSQTDVALESAVEAGSNESGSSPSADEVAWLTPMNAARAMVGDVLLHWDPIAAEVALTYASQCQYAHNPNAGAEYMALGGAGGLGENIAAGAPSQTVANAVGSWLAEQASYDHATNQCAAGKDCGHYTQIVWSTTTGVGCAAASCTANSPFGTFANGLWDFEVCDFSPPGNIIGRSPY